MIIIFWGTNLFFFPNSFSNKSMSAIDAKMGTLCILLPILEGLSVMIPITLYGEFF